MLMLQNTTETMNPDAPIEMPARAAVAQQPTGAIQMGASLSNAFPSLPFCHGLLRFGFITFRKGN